MSGRRRDNKDGFERSGPGRHSEKYGGRPERGERNERRGGSKPWENKSGSPQAPAVSAAQAPLPADDGWEDTPAASTNTVQPPARQYSRDNNRENRDNRDRDNRFNQEEREERKNDDWGNRTGGSGGRPDRRDNRGDTRSDNRGERSDNRGERSERRDNWGDRGQRRDFGNKDRDFGNKDRDFGNKDRDFGNKDRDFGNKDRDFGNRDRDFGNRGGRGGHDRPRSNFTPRDRSDRQDRSFDDSKSDKSFRSQGSGDRSARPPFKPRTRFPQVEYKEISNPVPLETPFGEPEVELGAQLEVSVTWIISPESFYTQILSLQPKFLEMMHKIPELYKGVKPYSGDVPVGSTVLARYPADGVLYRATVVSVQPFSKFIVRYVDFGNKQLVDARDIWQMDKELLELPKMAVHCSLIGVAPKDGEWKADTEIDLCFNAPRYQCVFQELTDDQYKVSLWNNGVSVADTLVEKQLAIMSEHQSSVTLKDEPIDMTIIVGQQILCRVTHVESFEKFCVHLDIDKAALVEQTISSYDVANLTPPAPDLIIEGTHCTVRYDGKICRAVLQDTSDKANIKAILADYGNVITTTVDNVMILPNELSVYYYQSLQCCLNNYTPESEKLMSLEQLKEKLTNNKFIIYINDVDEITLVSTLYDPTTGHKVPIFTPDEGAYDEVIPLCMRAVFNYNFGMAYVSHAENLNEFYLQKATDGNRLAQLLDDLYKFYEEGSPEPLTNFEVDGICVAKSTDGNWYRATIVTVEEAEVKVHFTDYGDSETFAKDSLKKLDSKFYEPCSLALVASLGLVALQADALTKLTEWTTEKEVQVTLTFGTDGWLANLHLDGVDLSMKLMNEKLATPQVVSNEEPKQEIPVEEPISLPQGCTQVYISHIDTPGHFWLQAVDKVDKIEEIQAELQANADSYPDIENREMGTLCIAKYLADEQWYRAEILDADSDITTVRFIDYGNTDVLDNQPGLIKDIPTHLKEIERYAIKTSVNAVPTGTGEWSEAASELFTQLVGDLSVPVDVVIVLKDVTTYVDIYVNGQNLTDKLVSEGHAARSEEAECGDLPSCFASHVNSPSEFWIQLESAAPELQAMEAAMDDAENFPELTVKDEGVICAAKYPEDGMWYRAQIIVDGSEGTEVLFMDYGNASIANELRSLSDDLKVKPALSRKCALQKPRDIKSWSRKSEIKFNELAAEGATIFNVQFIASGDISIVELYFEGKSVTEELVELCEEQPAAAERPPPVGQDLHSNAKLCYVQSLDEFYVNLEDSMSVIDKVIETMANAADFETIAELKVGSVCAAFWSEDEQWYRAKVLEFCDVGYHVQFIDYGNKSKCEEFRQLPEELAAMEPLAKCCRLAGVPEDRSLHEIGRNKLDEFAVEDVTFRIEYLDSTKEPTLVKVIVDGKDLISILTADIYAEASIDAPNESSEENIEKLSTETSVDASESKEGPEESPIKTIVNQLDNSIQDVTAKLKTEESGEQQNRSLEDGSEKLSTELNVDILASAAGAEKLNTSIEENALGKTTCAGIATDAQEAQLNTSKEDICQEKICEASSAPVVPNNVVESLADNPNAVESETIKSNEALERDDCDNDGDKEEQFDDAEEDVDKLDTQTDLNESIDSTHTVIENKSFEAQSDSLSDDVVLNESSETDAPTTPEKDSSSCTIENSTDTIKTPEREESKDSINTDTGYTSGGDHDKSFDKDVECPKHEGEPRNETSESPIKINHEETEVKSPEKNNSESPETSAEVKVTTKESVSNKSAVLPNKESDKDTQSDATLTVTGELVTEAKTE